MANGTLSVVFLFCFGFGINRDVDDKEMRKVEEARQAYDAALNAAKEKQDEESLAAAVSARLHLQSFLFKSE
ncbi:hypothetical protein Gotri_017400, partial [Gossypium trilobum]|nr:hypothetical protein [Gossypium trilobum]